MIKLGKRGMGFVGIILIIILIIIALYWFMPDSAPNIINNTAEGIKTGASKIGDVVSQYAQNTS